MSQIHKTTNYTQFKMLEGNRPVERRYVEQLKSSIKENNLLHIKTIDVTENLEVIDGQHRLIAAMELSVPIYYVIRQEVTGDDMVLLNISRSWKLEDFLNYYCKKGNKEYLKVSKIVQESGTNLTCILSLFNRRYGSFYEDFRRGSFKINENVNDVLYKVQKLVSYCKKQIYDQQLTTTRKFWEAINKLSNCENFNEEIFNRNFSAFSERVTKKVSSKDYFIMLVKIHNFRNQKKIPLNIEDIQEIDDKNEQ